MAGNSFTAGGGTPSRTEQNDPPTDDEVGGFFVEVGSQPRLGNDDLLTLLSALSVDPSSRTDPDVLARALQNVNIGA